MRTDEMYKTSKTPSKNRVFFHATQLRLLQRGCRSTLKNTACCPIRCSAVCTKVIASVRSGIIDCIVEDTIGGTIIECSVCGISAVDIVNNAVIVRAIERIIPIYIVVIRPIFFAVAVIAVVLVVVVFTVGHIPGQVVTVVFLIVVGACTIIRLPIHRQDISCGIYTIEIGGIHIFICFVVDSNFAFLFYNVTIGYVPIFIDFSIGTILIGIVTFRPAAV